MENSIFEQSIILHALQPSYRQFSKPNRRVRTKPVSPWRFNRHWPRTLLHVMWQIITPVFVSLWKFFAFGFWYFTKKKSLTSVVRHLPLSVLPQNSSVSSVPLFSNYVTLEIHQQCCILISKICICHFVFSYLFILYLCARPWPWLFVPIWTVAFLASPHRSPGWNTQWN